MSSRFAHAVFCIFLMTGTVVFAKEVARPGPVFGVMVGNGGGSWICREPTREIRWAKLIDLFEAEKQWGLTVGSFSGDYRQIVDLVSHRLESVDPTLSAALKPQLQALGYLQSNPPLVVQTSGNFPVVFDASYRVEPDVADCKGGLLTTDPSSGQQMIPYEQVVNYLDGNILVRSEIFTSDKFPMIHKAALVFHEAVYTYRREVHGDKDSVTTRRIVGLLFANLSDGDLKKALMEVDEGLPGDVDFNFVAIPAGSFTMGEDGRWPNIQGPPHRVTLTKGFEIMTTEVTQELWAKVERSNPSVDQTPDACSDWVSPERNAGVAMCPKNPVENISWSDAANFVGKLNDMVNDGYVYSLPTEAQWEYAARAGTTTKYFWGDSFDSAKAYAWFVGNCHPSMDFSHCDTHPVGLLQANTWGLFDMIGNVAEFVQDYFTYYAKAPVSDPASLLPTQSVVTLVVRGADAGSGKSPEELGSSERRSYEQFDTPKQVGFRLVRTHR